MTDATLASLKGEVLNSGAPKPRVAALKGEVLNSGAPKPRLAALKVEVLHSLANYAAGPPNLLLALAGIISSQTP